MDPVSNGIVIDFCLVKQMMCDWNTKFCCLETVWASQASLNQRRGRAGRVSSGRCYRLITTDFFTNHIPEYSIPEMQASGEGEGRGGGRGLMWAVHIMLYRVSPYTNYTDPLIKVVGHSNTIEDNYTSPLIKGR